MEVKELKPKVNTAEAIRALLEARERGDAVRKDGVVRRLEGPGARLVVDGQWQLQEDPDRKYLQWRDRRIRGDVPKPVVVDEGEIDPDEGLGRTEKGVRQRSRLYLAAHDVKQKVLDARTKEKDAAWTRGKSVLKEVERRHRQVAESEGSYYEAKVLVNKKGGIRVQPASWKIMKGWDQRDTSLDVDKLRNKAIVQKKLERDAAQTKALKAQELHEVETVERREREARWKARSQRAKRTVAAVKDAIGEDSDSSKGSSIRKGKPKV